MIAISKRNHDIWLYENGKVIKKYENLTYEEAQKIYAYHAPLSFRYTELRIDGEPQTIAAAGKYLKINPYREFNGLERIQPVHKARSIRWRK